MAARPAGSGGSFRKRKQLLRCHAHACCVAWLQSAHPFACVDPHQSIPQRLGNKLDYCLEACSANRERTWVQCGFTMVSAWPYMTSADLQKSCANSRLSTLDLHIMDCRRNSRWCTWSSRLQVTIALKRAVPENGVWSGHSSRSHSHKNHNVSLHGKLDRYSRPGSSSSAACICRTHTKTL